MEVDKKELLANQLFGALDKNKDGVLDREEFRSAFAEFQKIAVKDNMSRGPDPSALRAVLPDGTSGPRTRHRNKIHELAALKAELGSMEEKQRVRCVQSRKRFNQQLRKLRPGGAPPQETPYDSLHQYTYTSMRSPAELPPPASSPLAPPSAKLPRKTASSARRGSPRRHQANPLDSGKIVSSAVKAERELSGSPRAELSDNKEWKRAFVLTQRRDQAQAQAKKTQADNKKSSIKERLQSLQMTQHKLRLSGNARSKPTA